MEWPTSLEEAGDFRRDQARPVAGRGAVLLVTPVTPVRRRPPTPASRRYRRKSPASSGALDGYDALHLLQGLHHALQLLQVLTDEREEVHGAPVVARAAVGLADVDALGHEALADVRQDA